MQLDKAAVIHLVGIGGMGLSAIARLLVERGYRVSGSDRFLSPLAESLRVDGVQVSIGHRADNVHGATLVVRSSAVPDDNVEVQAAKESGIPVMKREQFLELLTAQWQVIAVAGTHGKTTTTGMVTWVLTTSGQDPSYIIGGTPTNLGVNAHAGQGAYLVIEADEYDHMFLGLKPYLTVVTNVEHDHPDCYPTAEDFYQAFLAFSRGVQPKGLLLTCGDDPGAARLLEDSRQRGVRAFAYGIDAAGLDYRAENLVVNPHGGFTFDVVSYLPDGFELRPAVRLQVPGKHNVLNATAALAAAHQLGLPLEAARLALGSYQGTGRRFEVRGEADGIVVIDDYAHHPTKIQATLSAARMRYPGRRLWALWQPHTYSRTRLYLSEFASALEQADEVVVTKIYPARETKPADNFTAQQVVAAMKHKSTHYIPKLVQATAFLLGRLRKGDVLVVMSAGDATQVSGNVLAALQERSTDHV